MTYNPNINLGDNYLVEEGEYEGVKFKVIISNIDLKKPYQIELKSLIDLNTIPKHEEFAPILNGYYFIDYGYFNLRKINNGIEYVIRQTKAHIVVLKAYNKKN